MAVTMETVSCQQYALGVSNILGTVRQVRVYYQSLKIPRVSLV